MLENADLDYQKETSSSDENEWVVRFNSTNGREYTFIFDKDSGSLNRIC